MTSPAAEAPAGRRISTQVSSLSTLVGAHPDALRKMYADARAADPAELGDAPRGRLLTIAQGTEVFLALRPLMRALFGGEILPWKGKTFDHGGNSGQNVILGRRAFRFHAEVSGSQLDGRPALVLTYDEPGHGNPWPLRAIRDELRTVGPGVAIGPALVSRGGLPVILMWFGLEAVRD
jgi:hypothetical protein